MSPYPKKEGDEIALPALVFPELQKEWLLLNTALNHTPDFIYVFDLEGRFTYVNQALLSLWQKSSLEAIGKNFFDLGYPPVLAERLQSQIQEVIDSKAQVRAQTPFTGPSGETREYEYIFVPVLDESGRAVSVVGSTRDITEQERAKDDRIRMEDSLSFALEAGGGVGTWDWLVPEDRVYCNPAFAALFSVDVHKASKGVPITEFTQSIHHEDRARVEEQIQNCLHTAEELTAEYRVVQPDQSIRWVMARGRCQKDGAGRATRFPGVVFDITERKKADEVLLRKNRELEEFAYVASHDLQEPLRMVKIYTQLLLKRCVNQDRNLMEFAGFVAAGTERMDVLLRDLLDFSHSVHEDDLPVGKADLSVSLQEAMEVLQSRIEEVDGVITAADLPTVRGDVGQLSHIFQNLISNALKYRKAGTTPIIHISAQALGNDVTICVQDNGIGFDDKYAEHIFGLFKRLHHRNEFEGTGLGLAICRRIVERYGGRIWAKSELGRGSEFYFSLPISF